jgi:hypothetical protein
MDLLGLAFVLPFLIGSLLAHLGHDFTEPNYDGHERGDR